MTLIWIQNGQQDKENDRLEKIWYYVSRKDDITDLAQTLFISVLQGELYFWSSICLRGEDDTPWGWKKSIVGMIFP